MGYRRGPGGSRGLRRRTGALIAAMAAALVLASPPPKARADGPTVAMLEAALSADPHSPSASLVLRRMARLGERGWRRLAAHAEELEDERLRHEAAVVLADGPEPARLDLVARLYDRPKTPPEVMALCAVSMARAYPRYARRLHAHVRQARPGALHVLRLIGTRGIPPEELEAAKKHESLASLASELLQVRGPAPAVLDMLPRARELAPEGLAHAGAKMFAAAFAEEPYRPLLRALAELLREPDEPRCVGAHCLLLTASGVDVSADADLWNAWIDAQGDAYVPPDPLSRGVIAAAVRRGVRYLMRDLAADGRCYHGLRLSRSPVGSTALAVLALRATGLPADDPVLRQAVEKTLVVRDAKGRLGLPAIRQNRGTYCSALLAMAYQALGAKEFAPLLPQLRDRLCEGMLETGEWTYVLHSEANPTTRMTGDHSNTQYANLGLRALETCGVKVEPAVWRRVEEHWRKNQTQYGTWGYRSYGKSRNLNWPHLTPGGAGGIAMALEALRGREAGPLIAEDPAIRRALWAVGRQLLRSKSLDGWTPYGLYALERGCAMCGVDAFTFGTHRFDWHREGAHSLLRRQNADGSWGRSRVPVYRYQYGCGRAPDTAFALLFLTRATATVKDAAAHRGVSVAMTTKDAAALPKRPGAPATPGTPRPWELATPREPHGLELRLASRKLLTCTGKAVVRGSVTGPWTAVRVGEKTVAPDRHGQFEAKVELKESGVVEVAVADAEGRELLRRVRVEVDRTPPTLTLVGPPERAAAWQRIELEANEPIDGVRIGRCFFPADGRMVTLTAELEAGMSSLPVEVYDLAGNRAKPPITIAVENRVLELDGMSAVRVPVPRKPATFTLECWTQFDARETSGALVSDAQKTAGGGLYLKNESGPMPFGLLEPFQPSGWLRGFRPLKRRRWTHLAMTYDGMQVRLWIDGKLAAKRNQPKYGRSKVPFRIGADPDAKKAWCYLEGRLDEVRLSDVVRYADSFKPSAVHAPDPHTVFLFHFDTDTQESFHDASGNGHMGEAVGTPKIVKVRR